MIEQLFSTEALIGFVGVSVGVALNVGKEFLFEWRNQNRLRRYAAIRIVCALDQFFEKCVAVALDNGRDVRQSHGQEEREPEVELPDPPNFASDIDWKWLDQTLAYEILSLPNRIEESKSTIAHVGDFGYDPPDHDGYFFERKLQFSELGLRTLELTSELRRKFGLPFPTPINPDWNPYDRLQEVKAELLAAKCPSAELLNRMNRL